MKKWLIAFIFIAVFSFAPTAVCSAAASELQVRNVNQTLIGNVTTSVRLNFHTEKQSSAALQPVPRLYYYKAGTTFNQATSAYVDAATTVYSSVAYHKVTISGLQAGQKYNYKIYDSVSKTFSKEFTFVTQAAEADDFSFIAAADANWRSTATYNNYFGNTLSAAVTQTPDAAFIVHTGSANSSLADVTHWEGFFSNAANTLENYPIVPNTISKDATNQLFKLNYNLDYSNYNLKDYSFVEGEMLFLSLNSQLTSTAEIAAHIKWLEDEIAAKGSGKWLIVSIGDNFYGSATNTSTIKTKLAEAFKANGVSLVLQGKEGAYTRSVPINGTTALTDYPSSSTIATKDGVVYLTPGASGIQQTNGATGKDWLAAASNFSASATNLLAEKKMYTKVSVSDSQLSVKAYTVDGSVVDSFDITQGETPARDTKNLVYTALNNAFGSDSKTTRTMTWQADKTMVNASVELVVQGQDFAGKNIKTFAGTTTANTTIFTSKMTNKVNLTGLTAGTTYQYRLKNELINKTTGSVTVYYSKIFSFQTEPEASRSYTFLNFSDSQGGSDSYSKYWGNTLSTALAAYPTAPFVIQNGDMVESITDLHYTNYFAATGDLLSSTAFEPVLGNHEGKNAEAFYKSVFSVTARDNVPLTYTFSYGNALFFNLNENYDSKAEMTSLAAWMKEIAGKAENKGKFIIVTMHKNPYGGQWTSQTSGSLASKNAQAYLYPTMEEIGVNLVLSGHDHNYIRSYPVKNGAANTSATNYNVFVSTSKDGLINMVTRNSGEKTYALINKANYPWVDVLWQPDLSTNLPGNTMYAAITVSSSQLIVKAQTTSGQVIDFYVIVK
jgi:hypothetical protein